MNINRIKYIVAPLAIFIAVFIALYPNTTVDMSKYSTEGLQLDYTVSKEIAFNSTENNLNSLDDTYSPYLEKTYVGFKEALGFKESRGNYFIVNTYGYLGKYQFGSETLKMIGIYNPQQFLHNPKLQEKAFLANIERNKWILRKDIKRFVGKDINGFIVTESGILAAAHLAGAGSVKKFLRSSGKNTFSDAYGATVTYYMKTFSGYDTSSIEANRHAKALL